ncbi:MAG: hypothetical protein FJW40_01815 [Acidobacteria bacterium]|nr:hypothetical protein [Acidobacteriota bacterium]
MERPTYLFVAPEEEEEFAAFFDEISRELSPQGALERVMFEEIVHAAWNERRILRIERRSPSLERHLAHYRRSHKRSLKAFHLMRQRGARMRQAQQVAELSGMEPVNRWVN